MRTSLFHKSIGVFVFILLISSCNNAFAQHTEDFNRFFVWVEDYIMRTPADQVTSIDFCKTMGFVLRKQMEKHHLYDPENRTSADEAALIILNDIHNEFPLYFRNLAYSWNQSDPRRNIIEDERWMYSYFESAFRGVDYDNPNADIDTAMANRWGVDPNAIPPYFDTGGGGGGGGGGNIGPLNDTGFEQFLGQWVKEESSDGGANWVTSGFSLRRDLSPSGNARCGDYLPSSGVYWRFNPMSGPYSAITPGTISIIDGGGNVVATFSNVGNTWSANYQERGPDGRVRNMICRIRRSSR